MKLLKSIKNLFLNIYLSLKRFPLTMIFSAAVVIMLITISEMKSFGSIKNFDILNRITMVLALGIPLTLCLKLIIEKKGNLNLIFKFLIYLSGGVFLVLYYFIFLKNTNMISTSRYIATSFAMYTIFLYIPYFYKRENIELYVLKVITRFLITFVYSLVLYGGLAAILFAIEKLLSVPLINNIYYYTWLIVAGIFVPGFFLGGIPKHSDVLDSKDYPAFFKVLLLYIVMPIASVYMLILYIYFGKIIVTRQWPINLVSNLVLWYSAICIGVIFLISPIKENQWVKKFKSWFLKLIIPILLMMFLSIGIRVKAYGITENRYYVILLGAWIFGITLYFNLSKIKRNIIIPLSLSIITIVSVFGPLSSFSLSSYSQNRRLYGILNSNNMINNGQIQKAPSNISNNDKKEITRILQYFESKDKLSDVKYLPDEFKITDMKNVFGFEYSDEFSPNSSREYFSYSLMNMNYPLEIGDYEYLFDFRYKPENGKTELKGIEAKYDYQSSTVYLYKDRTEIYKKDVNDFAKELNKKYMNQKHPTTNQEDMTFVDENEKVKVKFFFSNIYGNSSFSGDELKVEGADFLIMIKLK